MSCRLRFLLFWSLNLSELPSENQSEVKHHHHTGTYLVASAPIQLLSNELRHWIILIVFMRSSVLQQSTMLAFPTVPTYWPGIRNTTSWQNPTNRVIARGQIACSRWGLTSNSRSWHVSTTLPTISSQIDDWKWIFASLLSTHPVRVICGEVHLNATIWKWEYQLPSTPAGLCNIS